MNLKHSKILLWEGELTFLLGVATLLGLAYAAYIKSAPAALIPLIVASYLFMALGLKCDQEMNRIHNFDGEQP